MGTGLLAARFSLEGTALVLMGRFFASLFDGRFDSLDCVACGALVLGITCGVLGSFVIVRRQSLLGDAIGHSVLPGLCLGLLAAGSRSVPALLVAAAMSGLAAALLIALIRRTTTLKSGECMGLVFTGFYGMGIVLLKLVQRQGISGAAGLEKLVLAGQIATMSTQDLLAMAGVMVLSLAAVTVFYRPLVCSSFDEQFSRSTGVPVAWIDYLLTVLLTLAIVVGIQAVGVILISAMLIIPAATAYLLTDRLNRMLLISAVAGAAGGLTGAFFSFLDRDAPSGAFMVLSAATLFGAAFLLSPLHGLIPRAMRLRRRRQRIAAENLLHTLYTVLERRGTGDRRFGVHDVAGLRNDPAEAVRRAAAIAARRGWVDPRSADPIILTDRGLAEARRIVRNHRLWELFLTQQVNLAADHVHADAEYIEHLLPAEVLDHLEQMLDRPKEDPHGRPIPREEFCPDWPAVASAPGARQSAP